MTEHESQKAFMREVSGGKWRLVTGNKFRQKSKTNATCWCAYQSDDCFAQGKLGRLMVAGQVW